MRNDLDRRENGKSIRVSVSLPAEQHAALADVAKENRVSLAWVVRAAVEKYLETRAPLLERKG